jgi:hypothetical protein
MGTGATQAAPATAMGGGVAQGMQSIGATCGICQQPAVQQGLFIVAAVFFLVFWHTHLRSMMD